jgi:hypothetical protein
MNEFVVQVAKGRSSYRIVKVIIGTVEEATRAFEAVPLKKGEKKQLLQPSLGAMAAVLKVESR